MPRTTVIKGTAVSCGRIVTLGIALFLSPGQKQTSIIQSAAFVPNHSLVVRSTASFAPQIQAMTDKTVTLPGGKILVFSNKSCGSCLYLTCPIIEWVQKVKDTRFYSIGKADRIPLIDGELRSYQTFISSMTAILISPPSFGEPGTVYEGTYAVPSYSPYVSICDGYVTHACTNACP